MRSYTPLTLLNFTPLDVKALQKRYDNGSNLNGVLIGLIIVTMVVIAFIVYLFITR